MSRRTIVLLVVMGAVWVVAFFYLFKGNSGAVVTLQQEKMVDFVSLVSKIRIDPSLKKMVIEDLLEDLPKVFNPVRLAFGKEAADILIMTLPALNYNFLGFIKTADGVKIFLSDGKKRLEISGNNPIFERYVVTYVSSLGVLVLDVENGRFFSIR
ncbi:hypothetical protein [Thermotoga sp. SG1]|uniref:hypothetical protein n=1 Tax=Thermotoga sp. SG1 TaxID=126739 RepID=UPI000C77D50B|nr:hypothetical protein [Thermotoga sp. SG1]PLV57631.1 hypothetical protein AS006_01805 [Thermotoga sp. SG1]